MDEYKEYEGYKYLDICDEVVKIIPPFLVGAILEDDGSIRSYHLWTKDGSAQADLIYGQKSLDKYYKGSFEVWCEKMKEKRIKSLKKQRERAEEELKEAEEQLKLLGGHDF